MVKIPLAGMLTLEKKWPWNRGKVTIDNNATRTTHSYKVDIQYINFTSDEVPYRAHMCSRDHQKERVVHHRNPLPTYCSPNWAGQVVLY